MIPTKKSKKKNELASQVAKRQSDKLRTFKSRDIDSPGKEPENPLVINEDDGETIIDVIGGVNISKNWEDICKGFIQWMWN